MVQYYTELGIYCAQTKPAANFPVVVIIDRKTRKYAMQFGICTTEQFYHQLLGVS